MQKNNNFKLIKYIPDLATNEYQRAAAHLVRPSPWPIITAFLVGSLLFSSVSYFQQCTYGLINVLISLCLLLNAMYFWFCDIIIEGTIEGQHTKLVQRGLKFGMILFIISEIFFFVSFFWAFFHFALTPSVFIFCVWPPIGISVLNPWNVPYVNTAILLTSGMSLTYAHHAILLNKFKLAFYWLLITIFLGIIFTTCQIFEYLQAPFSINDSAYGSVFFMATGFHGLHVLVGTIFLIVCLFRLSKKPFYRRKTLGFWVCCMILTFCRCCLIIFIYNYLLMRFLIN